MSNRYIELIPSDVGTPYERGVLRGRVLLDSGHWLARYETPENICVDCGHSRNTHLDQPEVKGAPPQSDRGWCTRPEGSCIYQPCSCLNFVEPTDAQISAATKLISEAT